MNLFLVACVVVLFSSSLDEIWILLARGKTVETGRSWLSISGGEGLHMCLPGKLSSCGIKQQSCPLKRGHKQCHHILSQMHDSDFFSRSYTANDFKLDKLPPKQISRNIGGQEFVCVCTRTSCFALGYLYESSLRGKKERRVSLSLIVAVLNSFKL